MVLAEEASAEVKMCAQSRFLSIILVGLEVKLEDMSYAKVVGNRVIFPMRPNELDWSCVEKLIAKIL